MPRLGAVTRSMTRAGEAALLPQSEQEAATGVVARKLAVDQNTALTHEDMVYDDQVSKTSASSGPIVDSLPTSSLSVEVLTQNRMTILRLEQDGILAPGVLKIKPSGELLADLSVEPDVGTMTGLYPNMTPNPDAEAQFPSWLRDYLLKTLKVHAYGPPAVCRAFYDHLNKGEGNTGINHTVKTAESYLSYATLSLRYAIEEVTSFSSVQHTFKDTYDEEVGNVIKTIKRLVGYEGEAMPTDIRMLIDIAEMGIVMREALTEPLQRLIVTPYTHLLEKLELVSNALRMQLDRIDQDVEKARAMEGPRFTPDSGIHGCWT
ncbi:hypothetical protein N0V93_009298 [Gnomoniopsis smithogilvyi]|uniref:Uncharacterized protein n=1 Tax=Gnomoniopsis smithogilvyi TaxID=1191159 RepID=A0A9W8YLS2_9PEZI|nr:hypothetical protein N0V93_009298 [Gnomoniopsis smithogilvyi]